MREDVYLVPKDELYHYGVKGMKWGVRKNTYNQNYTAKQRKRDRAFYGARGEKRINKRLNEGHGLQGARHYEAERKARNEKRQKAARRKLTKKLLETPQLSWRRMGRIQFIRCDKTRRNSKWS